MKKSYFVVALLCVVLLFSCASIKSFTARFNIAYTYLPSDVKEIKAENLRGDGIIGSWIMEESIQHMKMVGDVTTSENEPVVTGRNLTVFGTEPDSRVLVDGENSNLSSTVLNWMSEKEEYHPVAVSFLRATPDFSKIVLVKLEALEDKATGISDCYVIVRTMVKVPTEVSFLVSFDTDGGTAIASQSVLLGEKATYPEDPSREGFLFQGWNYDFNAKVTDNVTVKALWEEEKAKEYSVVFNTDGGVYAESQVVTAGEKATDPGQSEKYGYVFKGWDFDFNTPITEDLTINALWEKLPVVTFIDIDGTTEEIIVTEGKLEKPEDPQQEGFDFFGWTTEDGTVYDFDNEVTEDLTLHATYVSYEEIETYASNFFDTRFYYSQCKDVQWYVSGGSLHLSGPAPLYCAKESRQLSVEELSDGAYVRFAKTEENGYYSQTLYNADGSVKMELSVKGTISYFGDYGFLYKADAYANDAWTEFCSFFYTNKGLNEDGTTPSRSEFPYEIETVFNDNDLENYGK